MPLSMPLYELYDKAILFFIHEPNFLFSCKYSNANEIVYNSVRISKSKQCEKSSFFESLRGYRDKIW